MPKPISPPYVGPRPFETADRDLFFGREREAEDILSLIMFHRTILLYAQSGAGKSSLINTSVIPGLAEAGFASFPIVRVRGAPSVLSQSAANIYVLNVINAIAPATVAPRDVAAFKLGDVLQESAKSLGSSIHGLVLVFDQFEELFTSHQERWQDREGLFRQLADALEAIPTLRVLFSMREDFIAELDPLVWYMPEGIDVRYRLELLRHDAAISAVIAPANRCGIGIDPEAAEKLVGDLLQTNIEGPGGQPRAIRGEYVEPVQLQIVCSRLWNRLPDDIQTITEAHLEEFGDVNDALREFYEAVVKEAARVTGYPEKLIHLGCTQFVTSSGTRSMVHRDENMVGLLPSSVVNTLVDQHFLRAEIRAAARWYEISHDRLIAPVLEKKLYDEELKTLLRTRDLLDAAVERWKLRREFVQDRHILTALSDVKGELVLSDDQLEFLCMNSIGASFEIPAWVQRLKTQAPRLLEDVLLRASQHPLAAIRRNATTALALADFPSTDEVLLRQTIDDPDAEVREQAAIAITQADRSALEKRMVESLATKDRPRAVTTIARMLNEGNARRATSRVWLSLHFGDRLAVLFALARVRLAKGWPTLLYVGVMAGLWAGIFCGISRMLPERFALTITGVSNVWGVPTAGLFQGMAGGIVWGGAVGAMVALGWVLVKRFGPGWMNRRDVGNVLFGTLGGIIGGIGVFAEIFFVFDEAVAVKIGWVPDKSLAPLSACIWETHRCLFHPLLGPAFGAGIGVALSALHTSALWHNFLAPHVAAGHIVDGWRTARQAAALGAMFSLGSGLLLYASALAFVFVWDFNLYRTIGETTTIYIGNIGAITGIIIGQLIMRVGIVIPPRSY